MHKYALVVAGLPVAAFDRAKTISAKLIAPGGQVFLSPVREGTHYEDSYVEKIISQIFQFYTSHREGEPITTLLMYVDYEDRSTEKLLDAFFPFALPLKLELPPLAEANNKNSLNRMLNDVERQIVSGAKTLRETSRALYDVTSVSNLTPLLLPQRNFDGKALQTLLRRLFEGLATSADPIALVKAEVKAFLAHHPWTPEPGSDKRCLSDGVHYFKSPGKHRHGFFRHSATSAHNKLCLLNVRSRVGGPYDYKFHYDCEACKGGLKLRYHDCHNATHPPKERHVNIAPNDFVIGS